MFLFLKSIGLFFVLFATTRIYCSPYRPALSAHFLGKTVEKEIPFLVSSIDHLKEKILGATSSPALVCITSSAFPSSGLIYKALQETEIVLAKKVQICIVDLSDQSMMPFVFQIQQQLNLVNLPLPAFIFFQKSSIVLPIQAGLISAQDLTALTRKRFNLSS